jgi:hypothetical protein
MLVEDLREYLQGYKPDDQVLINVHDTVLYEDLYDFDLDAIKMDDGFDLYLNVFNHNPRDEASKNRLPHKNVEWNTQENYNRLLANKVGAGSFECALIECFFKADNNNKVHLVKAFPSYFIPQAQ